VFNTGNNCTFNTGLCCMYKVGMGCLFVCREPIEGVRISEFMDNLSNIRNIPNINWMSLYVDVYNIIYRGTDIMKIKDKNDALLNLKHDHWFIRQCCEKIVRGLL
jgi:hypothetical protein